MSLPSDSERPPTRSDLTLLLAVAVAALVAAVAVTGPMAWSYDSGTYALVSQELLAGNGFSTRIVEPEHSRAALPEPQLTKAPLYPLTLATLGGLSLNRRWPARAINVAAHALTAAGLFLLVRLLGGAVPALIAGLVGALGFPTLYVAHWIWTESLFVALSVLFLCSVIAVRRTPGVGRLLTLCGALACLVVATRQAGLFVLPVLARELQVIRRSADRRRLTIDAAALFGPTAFVLAAMTARNLWHTGSPTGIDRPDQGRALGEVVASSARQIGSLLRSPGWELAGLIVLAACALGALLFVVRSIRASRGARWLRDGLDQALIAIGAYSLVLVWGMVRYQPRYEARFFVPWVVLALPPVTLAVWGGWRFGTAPIQRRIGTLLGALTLAALLAMTVASTVERWKVELRATGVESSPALETQTFAWARRHLEAGELVASNRAMELALFLDLSVIALPEREWNPRQELPGDAERWLTDRLISGGGRTLVLFAGPGELSEADWGAFIARLARREAPGGRLRAVWDSADGVAYELAGR
jgi:4-amino-4-deoxy-L-arabinose transferase-like glycosyltransferase